jgi:uncharacterized caspase-like protein
MLSSSASVTGATANRQIEGATYSNIVPSPRHPESARIALVIGNSHYEGGAWPPLVSPVNDARAIARALKSDGFQLDVFLDVTQEGMENAIRGFVHKLRLNPGAVAIFYYAGHGTQARRTPDGPSENFLIPMGSEITEEFEVPLRAISETALRDQMEAADVEIGIVVLDSCRHYKLRHTGMGSLPMGMAPNEQRGFLIAYSAEPGREALDTVSDRGLSPYARRLSEQLVAPGKSITDVFIDTGRQVIKDTDGAQKPEVIAHFVHKYYLVKSGENPHLQPP